MNGPEHYAEAERLLGLVATGRASLAEPWTTSVLDDPVSGPTAALAAAQVHATLAQVAATLTAAEAAAGPAGVSAVREHRVIVFRPWTRAGVIG